MSTRPQPAARPKPTPPPPPPPFGTLPGWVILPLRLFLGASFLLAGLDKLFDPTFLDPQAPAYLGNQLASAAPGTPLEGLLLNFAVPRAEFFGVLVMGGEICIGIAMLLGLLTRFSALMGLLLSLTFFLSITWTVQPFYFGADLPYAAGWLTLLLAGPGPFALDLALRRWLEGGQVMVGGRLRPTSSDEELLTRRAFVGLGAAGMAGLVIALSGLSWGRLHPAATRPTAATPTNGGGNIAARTPPAPPTAAAAATVAPTEVAQAPAVAATRQAAPTTSAPTASAAATSPTAATAIAPAPTATAAPQPGTLIAGPNDLPVNRSGLFQLPSGDPAVLVHSAGGYSAFSAVCTHEGCTVRPSTGTTLRCPCHGATFDGANGARVVRGPARRALPPVTISVASDGSVYLPD